MVAATVLVDGRVAGMWRLRRGVVEVEQFDPADDAVVADELARLRSFVAAGSA